MQIKAKYLVFYACVFGCFTSECIYALGTNLDSANYNSAQFVPMPPLTDMKKVPMVALWGFTSDKTVGKGQILFPLMLNTNKAFYLATEGSGAINSSDWMAGLGGGYRQVVNNKILGGYLLGDYNIVDGNTKFLVLNPGFESLGKVWDWRANGYFPIGSKTKNTNNQIGWESDIGNYSYVTPSGHDWSDHQYQEKDYVHLGNGVDVEFGRTFKKLNNLRAYLGGYYFDIKDDSSITGVEGRINYPVNDYMSLEARDSYDNDKNNTFLLGFRIKFGGISKNSLDNDLGIETRLLDPIEHNFAASANGNSVSTKKESTITDLGQSIVRYDDVQYVDSNAEDGGDGTYENPYNEINNDTIDAIELTADTAHIFIEDEDTPYNMGTDALDVPENYSIWGFENDFRKLASGDNRPELDGTMTLAGNNSLSSFELVDNSTSGTTAITIGDGTNYADNVYMDNVVVNASNATSNTGNTTAVYVNYGNLILGNNNSINSSTSAVEFAYGILATNNSEISINGNNNTITALNTNTDPGTKAYANAITLHNASTLDIYGNNNAISAISPRWANGIAAYEGSTINIYGDHNTMSGTETNTGTGSTGVYVNNSTLNVEGNNNSILVSSNAENQINTPIMGIQAVGNSIVNIDGDNNLIAASSSSSTALIEGVQLSDTSQLNITGDNNTISASGSTSSNVEAIYMIGGNPLVINISGEDTDIIADNDNGSAYGIYSVNLTADSLIYVANTDFDVTANGNNAYGIYLGPSEITLFNPNTNLTVIDSVFDIQSSDGNTSYGIYNNTGTDFTSEKYNELLTENIFVGDIQSGNQVYPAPPILSPISFDLTAENNIRDLASLRQFFYW